MKEAKAIQFDINDSVWIAAAAMSYEIYHKKQKEGRTVKVSDFILIQSNIRNRTLEINGHKAEGARTSQWCCGDRENHSNCYLRAVDDKRRLSFPGEFGGKEEPVKLDMSKIISTAVGDVTIQQLFDFVHTEYAALANQVIKKTTIDDKSPLDLSGIDITKKQNRNTSFPKNMILYGPPGTGKTYNAAKYAVAICQDKPLFDYEDVDYEVILKKYNELIAAGRIVFTTFHQSYGYEEFIEGIKPVLENQGNSSLGYQIESGIFKQFCDDAQKVEVKNDGFDIPDDASVWKVTVRSNVREDCFANNRVRIDWDMESNGAHGFVYDMKKGDVILTTDGSRSMINGIAIAESDDAFKMGDTKEDTTTRDVTWLAKNINTDITDINNGKMLHRMTCARVPNMNIGDIVSLAMKKNASLVGTRILHNDKPYVFIIDEINRGNISKIFGELITLIEETKRKGAKEEMSAMLPYSGVPFSVPENVYILGTMNTADRSIALLDTALRRRFHFEEMMPDSNVIAGVVVEDGGETIDVARMLDVINERIEFLYDREHTIGHAFFTKLRSNPSLDVLADIFRSKVVPLLQEYFYEDYAKIQLILGDNEKSDPMYQFILDEPVKVKSVFKGNPEDIVDLPETKYTIQNRAFQYIQSYKEIV